MRKRLPFWIATMVALGTWLLVNWVWQNQVEARQVPLSMPGVQERVPLQQSCDTGPDFQIQRVYIEPDPPIVDQPYQVHVEIVNAGIVTGTQDSVTGLCYNWEDATCSSPDLEVYANTQGLGPGQTTLSHFAILTGTYTTVGYHYFRIRLDIRDDVAEDCGGEGNNTSNVLEVNVRPGVVPTPTSPPTPTPFPKPDIFDFTPATATIARGDAVTLEWQVYGEAVSVSLDGEAVPLEGSYVVYPTTNHVYVLNATNPGGTVQKTSRITVVDPTSTPTPTLTPCAYAVIHEFGAIPMSTIRGGTVTLYWDVAGATGVYLNGQGVEGVSQRTIKVDQTTTFVLVARNVCGDVEESLTIQASYATPTTTPSPTLTSTPTRTPTATSTPLPPTRTPTRVVLPTPTLTPTEARGTSTTTATLPAELTVTATRTLAPFDSPLQTPVMTPVPSPTETATPTSTVVPITLTPTPTLTPVETATGTPSSTASPPATATTAAMFQTLSGTVTQTPESAGPVASPTPLSGTGTLRMYLCPLAILLVFAVGVIVLSLVLPRLQERRHRYGEEDSDLGFGVDEQPAFSPSPAVLLPNPLGDEYAPSQGRSATGQHTDEGSRRSMTSGSTSS